MFYIAQRTVSAVNIIVLLTASCVFIPKLAGQNAPVWTTTLQTGFADTFQLTLGGTFGNGPAWQNKMTTGLSNAFRAGDSLSIYGWNTFDLPSRSSDWQVGFGYKARVLSKRSHTVTIGSGLQHWRFPSVKTGTNDWLIPANLLYQSKIRSMSFSVINDSWTLVRSPLPTGSLLHTQAWLQHLVFKREHFAVVFKHGPAYTYSWNFYGANGSRIFRYQSMVAITWKKTVLEGGFRKQWGLQPGIHDNAYWQFALTRTLTHKSL